MRYTGKEMKVGFCFSTCQSKSIFGYGFAWKTCRSDRIKQTPAHHEVKGICINSRSRMIMAVIFITDHMSMLLLCYAILPTFFSKLLQCENI